jgi:hypothetical protein
MTRLGEGLRLREQEGWIRDLGGYNPTGCSAAATTKEEEAARPSSRLRLPMQRPPEATCQASRLLVRWRACLPAAQVAAVIAALGEGPQSGPGGCYPRQIQARPVPSVYTVS